MYLATDPHFNSLMYVFDGMRFVCVLICCLFSPWKTINKSMAHLKINGTSELSRAVFSEAGRNMCNPSAR